MKKILLSLGFGMIAFLGQSQVITYVESPGNVAGNYAFSYAVAASGWGVPDLTDPLNAVRDTLAFVSDGTAADSLGCGALVNGSDVNGKIAVIYRGACQFGLKSKNAQDAGAVAVIIINNAPGDPISMGGGTDGPNVTIPVVMITQAAGEMLKDAIGNGNVIAFIGSKSGYYGNDVGFFDGDVLRAQSFCTPTQLAQNGTEFNVPIGAWVRNYGSNNQANITLTATINFNGNNIYNESATVASIASLDSSLFSLPTFQQSSYASGRYELTYSVSSDSTDEFNDDNMVIADFMLSDSLFSLGRLNDSTQTPVNSAFYRVANGTGGFTECVHFRNDNASRLAAMGLTFSASNRDATLDGEYFELYAFQWDDQFTDLNDPAFAMNSVNQVGFAEYFMEGDLQQTNVYSVFDEPVIMEDGVRYLFCITNLNTSVYLGYDGKMNYALNENTYLQPLSPIQNNGAWSIGFGPDVIAALSVRMANNNSIAENNNYNVVAYPNPATDLITIPTEGMSGVGTLNVVDITGKMVVNKQIPLGGVNTLDVSNFDNGTYIFTIILSNGSKEVFKVNVVR